MPKQRIFASVLSTIFLAALILTVGPGRAAADDCLAAPGAASPPGRHWHYHLDRTSHRKCWHLSAAGTKATQSAGNPANHAQPAAAPTQASQPQPWVAPPIQTAPGTLSVSQQPVWSSPPGGDIKPTGVAAGEAAAPVPISDPALGGPSEATVTAAGAAPSPASSATPAETAVAASSMARGPSQDPSAPASEAISSAAAGAAESTPLAQGGVPQPTERPHSFAMIGGALALATGMGLAISGWLVRRRDVLHRDALGSGQDTHFVAAAPPFVAAGPEVFRPRERAAAVLPAAADEGAVPVADGPPGDQQRRVRVEELEETLRDVMQALRRSAA